MLKSLFNKVAGFKASNFVNKRLQHRCFPVNITKFLRTSFLTEHLGWLILKLIMNEIVSHSIFQNTGFLWRLFSFIRTASIRTAFTIEVIRHLKSYWFPARFFVVWLVHRKQIRTPYNILVQYLFYSIEAAIRVVLCKKVFLKISQNSQENTCAKVSFLIKLQAWQKNHFYRTLLDGCFWLYLLDYDLLSLLFAFGMSEMFYAELLFSAVHERPRSSSGLQEKVIFN